MTDKPTDDDRKHAELILDHLARLRELADFAGSTSRPAQLNFVACCLRNERLGLTKEALGVRPGEKIIEATRELASR